MKAILKTHLDTLTELDRQRIIWLRMSGFITVAVISIIVGWDSIHEHHLSFLVATIGLTVAVLWWYWTMIIIRKLITTRMTENEILTELADDFEELKNAVEEFKNLH